MTKEFIPHPQALALRELEFDEDCFGYYNIDPFLDRPYLIAVCQPFKHEWCLPAPLYQQAFRWFREKYFKSHAIVQCEPSLCQNKVKWLYKINHFNKSGYTGNESRTAFDTYEEAELACLNKLIELIK